MLYGQVLFRILESSLSAYKVNEHPSKNHYNMVLNVENYTLNV